MDIKEFWDNCHTKKLKEPLSGSTYTETIEGLMVENLIMPGKHVLEVGIGFGHAVKGLYNDGLIVSALDVSIIGLNNVKEYCEYLFTDEDLEKIPSNYYDIILCTNVIQHIPTDLLIKELEHLVRSLKMTGVFAIEFVSNDRISDMGNTPDFNTIINGYCCRSLDYMCQLISTAGGDCKLLYSNNTSGETDVKACHMIHVYKKGIL